MFWAEDKPALYLRLPLALQYVQLAALRLISQAGQKAGVFDFSNKP